MISPRASLLYLVVAACAGSSYLVAQQSIAPAQSAITLDEYMSSTEIVASRIAPDGRAAVVETRTPDWQHDRFQSDLWLWQQGAAAIRPLTASGHDSAPAWSPDGSKVAFISDRPVPEQAAGDKASRIWIIARDGGEAVPLYREKLDVNTFAWSADGTFIYLSMTDAPGKDDEEKEKKQWKDVKRMREQEHGDLLLRMPVAPALESVTMLHLPSAVADAGTATAQPAGSVILTRSPFAVDGIAPAPEGGAVAFVTASVSHRVEKAADFEIYLVNKDSPTATQLTHNQAREASLQWSPDAKHLYFSVPSASGSVEASYQDVQGRLYDYDLPSGKLSRLGAIFPGSLESYTVTHTGQVIASGLSGLEQHIYEVTGSKVRQLDTGTGTYTGVDAARNTASLLFSRSAIGEPAQVYLASSVDQIAKARTLTTFNRLFTQRATPSWRPFQWKSEDGTRVEGVLLFPPGAEHATHLRMLTLIHGGPGDADGNHFGADWYDWAALAAARGWLVFRPNYRGSTGYGDPFMLQIAPHLVSTLGKDILSGVDALVEQGFADPEHLAIGGYSYGGYMTNWLITQTHRFKAAVTGAGAVEHAANWGNDDLTFDDAWYLGGAPWQQSATYTAEAALFHMDQVTTPTHIVGGDADVRVSYFEDVVLERALQALNVPHTLLTFPGEGHPLANNPWHGYIKVRDELEWLDQYAGPQTDKSKK